jgi:hypothetical protein
MRILLAPLLVLAAVGCGGEDSYTSKALDEYRAGKTYDFRKGKRPAAKDVAAWEKKAKNYPAGSKQDLFQAFRILSNQRDHDDIAFTTLAKSSFIRTSYGRVFGKAENLNTKESPNSWSHTCTDGKVMFRGYWKMEGDPDCMLVFPQKMKN